MAQQGTSEIGGTIRDETGGIIPGAAINLVNQQTGTGQRSTVSGDDGSYLITQLRPGVYRVTVEMEGFKKAARSDVRLTVGRRQNLDVSLAIGEISETVTVTGAAQLVDTTSKEVGGVVDDRELIELPSVNRNYIGFVGLLPGVLPNISTESFGSDSISVNGQDRRNANYLIDGISNNDDVIGQRAGGQTRVALETVEEFQVITNQFDAEFGRTSGAIVNAITKSGTNQFHGSGFGFFQDSSLNAHRFFTNANNLEQPETSLQQFGGTVGGPIYTDVAHFFFSIERVLIDEGVIINIPARPEFNQGVTEATKAINTMLKGDVQISDKHQLSVRWFREASPQLNQIINNSGRPVTINAAREESDVDQNWLGSVTSTFGPRFVNQLRFGVTRENVAFANPGFNGGTPQADLPPLLLFDSFADGANDVAQGRINNSYQADEVISWLAGNHNLRFGAQYNYVTGDNFNEGRLNGRFTFPTDQPFDPTDATTYPERLNIRVGGPSLNVVVNHNIGLFFQDKWQVNPKLSLSLGLRWDKETITKDDNNIGPRVGFAWDPRGDGRTVIRGGYGIFYDRTPFSLFGAFTTDAFFVSSFTRNFPLGNIDPGPSNGQFPTDPTLVNGPVVNQAAIDAIVGTGTVLKNSNPTIDSGDRAVPYVGTFSIGLEQEVREGWVLQADYIHSNGEDQWVGVDLNAGMRTSTSTGSPVIRPDTEFNTITTRLNQGETEYDALQLQFQKRFARGYSFRFAYTLGHARGTSTGDTFSAASFQQGQVLNLDLMQGRTRRDVRQNFVFSGSWAIPKTSGLSLSTIVRALSGEPFSLTNSRFDANQNGINFDPLSAGTYTSRGPTPFTVDFDGKRNGASGPGSFQADARLQYKRNLGEHLSGAFTFEVFNLTNHANFGIPSGNFSNSNPNGTPSINFLNLSGTGIPRTVQLGFRVEF